MQDDVPFAFAGLGDAWKEPGGDWLQSYSLITTDANELASDVIDRMPVILHPKDYARWLDRDDERPPLDLLRPFESDAMVKWGAIPPLAISETTARRCWSLPESEFVRESRHRSRSYVSRVKCFAVKERIHKNPRNIRISNKAVLR